MRLLHTSDWHLGRCLHGESLLGFQREFLAWLVALAEDRGVDAVLVAGDVYDRAVPPLDAVAVLDEALSALSHAGIPVVVTGGNHDSAVRLGFGGALAAHAGVHLRTRLDQLTEPVLVGDAAIYGIPYLLPDAVMAELGVERSHTAVLREAVRRIRADAAGRGVSEVVALAHAFVTGGAPSDSERDIRVGGIGDVPASIFAGLTYVALGHLHGAQQVAPNARYSGSPLPFSFSERHHHKSVTIVDVAADGSVSHELVRTPVARPMVELRGRLDELLADPSAAPRDAWVRAVLTDPSWPASAMERLREVWPHTLTFDCQPAGALVDPASDLARLRQVSDPVEVCALFVQWVDSTYPDGRAHDELHSAVEAAVRDEALA